MNLKCKSMSVGQRKIPKNQKIFSTHILFLVLYLSVIKKVKNE